MPTIYKITNLVNQKKYVGCSSLSFNAMVPRYHIIQHNSSAAYEREYERERRLQIYTTPFGRDFETEFEKYIIDPTASHQKRQIFDAMMQYGKTNFEITIIGAADNENIAEKLKEAMENEKPEYVDSHTEYKIFKIVNQVNNDFYIGATTKHLGQFRNDLSETSDYLQYAVEVHGIDNFYIELIEEVIDENDKVNTRVKELIETMKPKYNGVI